MITKTKQPNQSPAPSRQFSMFEAVMTALCDKFESLRAKKPLLVVVSCGVMFLLGTTMCLEGGVFLFEVFDCYAAGLAILVLSISQLVCVQYVYGESPGSRAGPKGVRWAWVCGCCCSSNSSSGSFIFRLTGIEFYLLIVICSL